MPQIILLILLIVSGSYIVVSAQDKRHSDNEKRVQRGLELVIQGKCNYCHTPLVETEDGLVPDTKRTLSGHPSDSEIPEIPSVEIDSEEWLEFLSTLDSTAWAGEWGISFAANLTPDSTTGIGKWNKDVFVEIMRSGRHVSLERNINPPMPWKDYAKLSDEDLYSIFAYLSTLKPINNAVPKPKPLPKK